MLGEILWVCIQGVCIITACAILLFGAAAFWYLITDFLYSVLKGDD